MDNPINDIMITSMTNLKEMIDVDTIVGNPVQTPDGSTLIPISKVSFGLAAGGGQYGKPQSSIDTSALDDTFPATIKYPFAGGTAAGVSITPIAFIFAPNSQNLTETQVQLVTIDKKTTPEKLVDAIPGVIDKISCVVRELIQQTQKSQEPQEPQQPQDPQQPQP